MRKDEDPATPVDEDFVDFVQTAGPAGRITRRAVICFGAALLSGCVSNTNTAIPVSAATPAVSKAVPPVPLMYEAVMDEGYTIPAIRPDEVDPQFWRTEIDYPTSEKSGTLIVDTPSRFLYHVLPGGRATRYGVGVGREGFAWAGRAKVAYKRKWPKWTPPDSMVERQPELAPFSIANGGMKPGLQNPLGSRALYIHEGGRDTLYRLHGTNHPKSIGRSVSSGCIRLLSQDVIHLYDNVKDGSPIVVIPDPAMASLLPTWKSDAT